MKDGIAAMRVVMFVTERPVFVAHSKQKKGKSGEGVKSSVCKEQLTRTNHYPPFVLVSELIA